MKTIHDHILEAFYKRKYIERVEFKKKEKRNIKKMPRPLLNMSK